MDSGEQRRNSPPGESNRSQSNSAEAPASGTTPVEHEQHEQPPTETQVVDDGGLGARKSVEPRILQRARLSPRSGLVRLRAASRRASESSSVLLDCCITLGAV